MLLAFRDKQVSALPSASGPPPKLCHIYIYIYWARRNMKHIMDDFRCITRKQISSHTSHSFREACRRLEKEDLTWGTLTKMGSHKSHVIGESNDC